MKRIVLLIFLVMMATYFLRGGEDRWDNEPVLAHRSPHVRKPKHSRSPISQGQTRLEKTGDAVEAEWSEPIAASPMEAATRKISSGMMATEERAKADAVRKLEEEVSLWLEPEVPTDWNPPVGLVRSLIQDMAYTPVVKEYGTLYIAELTADTSGKRRDAIVAAYHREMVRHRMLALGGSLAFVLVCLGAVSGYIRADEATRGYYTNRLRMLAAAGVGAAGVAAYRFI